MAALAPAEPPGPHLQKLGILLAQLLEQGRQQRRILLNHLPHILVLGLVPQELQGVLSRWQEEGMWSDPRLGSQKRVLTADTPHAHLPTHSPASVAGCSDTWLSWTEPCSGSGLPGIPCQGSYLVLKHRPPAASLLCAQPWQETGEAHPPLMSSLLQKAFPGWNHNPKAFRIRFSLITHQGTKPMYSLEASPEGSTPTSP